jgi:hypothetical protein
VPGGTSSTGTVTISTAAPAGGTSVILSSGNPQAASVPATVTIPAGATSATFPITTSVVPFTQLATIDATYAGTLQARLTITAPVVANADTVSIGRVEYDTSKHQLRVEATSSRSGAILRVYYTGTDTLIGTLSGGTGQFSVGLNPVNITVRSPRCVIRLRPSSGMFKHLSPLSRRPTQQTEAQTWHGSACSAVRGTRAATSSPRRRDGGTP